MQLLAEGAKSLGIQLSKGQLDQFELYYRELAEWNGRSNLTSLIGYEEVQVRHFLDSLTVCLPYGGQAGLGVCALPGVNRVVDIGAGAGFPGLPLKLAFPSVELHLIESVGKKTAFLDHLVGSLGLAGVNIHTGRAEALARLPELRESFDLGAVGGHTVAHKHGGLDAELTEAEFALSELGGRTTGVFPVTLEGLTDDRVVVQFEKAAPTPERYPRRVGIPAKRPL
ncbi:Ribosomal RNA small subunit methyltransferase G [Geodia barretti]|uniref:Ribosomal RNA small subunit methyltransferase G n=1 Tax=Geodia barretti TaxID=519541 RepID=A0AA35SLD2_GEOBA|nr:Ribosomal RNA small subunit methyltransferase G [Geodia barretti]